MNRNRLLSAVLLSALVAFPLAGSAQQGDPHHPAPQAAQQTVPAQVPANAMGRMQMMGGGMMGGRMMSGMFDHVEGRIAFLKAELRINEAQTSAWETFAEALRTSAKRMGDLHETMMKPAPAAGFADRLDARERMLSAALESMRSIKTAFAGLNSKLDATQRKTADELLLSPMGMGMMGTGMMNMGGRGQAAE